MAEQANALLHFLYETQYEKLLKAAYYMMGSMEDAQDLVQQSFLLALIRQDKLSAHPVPEGWLMLTLHNLVKNERRKARNHAEVPLAEIVEPAGPEEPPSLEHILPRELPQRDREILIWRFERGLDYREMAAQLGVSESACRSRVSRAVVNCRKCMKKSQNIF